MKLTKKYRIVWNDKNIILADEFPESTTTETNQHCYESDLQSDFEQKKTDLINSGISLTNPEEIP